MKILLDKDVSMAPTLWNAILLFYGFGRIHSKIACIKMGIRRKEKLENITQRELTLLSRSIGKGKFVMGRTLEHFFYEKTKTLKDMRCYRALRIRQTLPIRGRTRSNAKTSRKIKPWDGSRYAQRRNTIEKKAKERLLKKNPFSMSYFYDKANRKKFKKKKSWHK